MTIVAKGKGGGGSKGVSKSAASQMQSATAKVHGGGVPKGSAAASMQVGLTGWPDWLDCWPGLRHTSYNSFMDGVPHCRAAEGHIIAWSTINIMYEATMHALMGTGRTCWPLLHVAKLMHATHTTMLYCHDD